MVRRILVALAGLLLLTGVASAQAQKCVATAAARSATEGQAADLSCDLNRNLRISGTISGAGDATAANQVTGNNSLGVMDDWDESDRAKVNPIVGQAGVAAGAGAVGTTVQRMTLASDDPGVAALQAIQGSAALIPTATSTNAITPVVSTAVESNHVLKAGAGNLYGFSATTGASAGYVLVFNATSAPSDGAVTPILCYSIPATSSVAADFRIPAVFSTGITIVFSTTGCFTKTASATAFFAGMVK